MQKDFYVYILKVFFSGFSDLAKELIKSLEKAMED